MCGIIHNEKGVTDAMAELNDMIRRLNGENEAEQTEEAKLVPVDGFVAVSVPTGNRMAFLSVYPPQNGGRSVTFEEALRAVKDKGVSVGINETAIREAVKNPGESGQVLAAEWQAPVDGEDGTIEYLFDKEHTIAPKEDEKGFVDYKNLGTIRNIVKGTPIANITLPTEGEPGVDILGRPVAQRKGKKPVYVVGKGTVLNAPGTQILASTSGHLTYSPNGGFAIEDTVVIRGDVDASVGNLDFIGDIVIKGEVMEGFKVASQKNITINGNATGASIEAGLNVTIKKGCINSNVIAHGDVNVGFCENAKIVCDGNLKSQTFVACDVYCAGTLFAQGGDGVIMGGKYIALQNIEAQSIGTKSYTPTSITVGDNAMMTEEREGALKEISKIATRMITLKQVVDFINEKKKHGTVPPEREEMLSAAIKERIKLNCNKTALERRIKEINAYLQNKENLSVSCNKYLYPGVRVVINDAVYTVTDEWVKVRLVEENGDIKPVPM